MKLIAIMVGFLGLMVVGILHASAGQTCTTISNPATHMCTTHCY